MLLLTGLIRILDRDLRAAGIAKRDDRGRTVAVHGMRTTFGTHLSKGGVPLRTAQAALRHSKPDLTANVYTDPRHGAGDDPQSVSACEDKRKPPLTRAVHGGREKRVIGLEPTTFTLAT